MATYTLELVTPERLLLSAQVKSVRAPGIEGSFGVLAGHAPFMTALRIGFVKVEYENGDIEHIAISGGFAQVLGERMVVLADSAERAADIDISRAEAAIARAREQLTSGEATDYGQAREALERATNRLQVVQMQKG